MTSEPPMVVAYRAEWPDRAASLIEQLKTSLGERVDRVEHIGSTAIAGMAAKDLLDVQASVADLGMATGDLDGPLAALGFGLSPHERDHVPAGRSDDQSAWQKRLWIRRGHDDGDVNLHVRQTGSANERLALLFRDWFRAHPQSIAAYAAFKRALAGAVADTNVYADVKDPVVDLVIATAEVWAASVGWRP